MLQHVFVQYDELTHLRSDAYGCVNWDFDDEHNGVICRIKVKSACWLKKRLSEYKQPINFFQKIRLHILLHELGHIANRHFNFERSKTDFRGLETEYMENLKVEVEAWLYACRCVKDPEEILSTIAITGDLAVAFELENSLEELLPEEATEIPY